MTGARQRGASAGRPCAWGNRMPKGLVLGAIAHATAAPNDPSMDLIPGGRRWRPACETKERKLLQLVNGKNPWSGPLTRLEPHAILGRGHSQGQLLVPKRL